MIQVRYRKDPRMQNSRGPKIQNFVLDPILGYFVIHEMGHVLFYPYTKFEVCIALSV